MRTFKDLKVGDKIYKLNYPHIVSFTITKITNESPFIRAELVSNCTDIESKKTFYGDDTEIEGFFSDKALIVEEFETFVQEVEAL
ncbi:MAG: hypothetical protein V3V00_15825 [Saprospiraceae bacterium]